MTTWNWTSRGRLAGAPLFLDDSAGLSILQLRAKARRMWQQYGIKLFVIDYLQLLHSTARRAENRQQEIADISNGIKALAKELQVPVIVLSGLNQLETAVRCMKLGAFDYYVKTGEPDRLLSGIRKALELRSLQRENRELTTRLLRRELKRSDHQRVGVSSA